MPFAALGTRGADGAERLHCIGAPVLASEKRGTYTMDHPETQFHQEIIHTRQAIDEKLAQFEHWRWQTIHETRSTVLDAIDYETNAQWIQKTRGRSFAIMERYPWLIIAGGMLLGYCLSRQGAAQYRPTPRVVRSYEVTSRYPPICPP
jgi:hypothetical protein